MSQALAQHDCTHSTWIQSWAWDLFYVFSGLWVIAIFGIAELGFNTSITAAVVTLAIGNLVFWAGHNISPVLIAWSNPRLRAEMSQRRLLYLGLPIGLTVSAIALELLSRVPGWSLKWETPWGVFYPSIVFFVAYLLWNSWHFGSQHFGILTLYRRRVRPEDFESRTWDAFYCRMLFCIALPLAWFAQGQFLGPLFGLLPKSPPVDTIKTTVVVLTLLSLGVMIIRELRTPKISLARIFYFVLVAAQPILAVLVNPIFHFAIYTSTHYMLVIALTSRIFSFQNAGLFGLPASFKIPGFFPKYGIHHFLSLLIWSPLLYWLIFRDYPRTGMEPVHRYLLALCERFSDPGTRSLASTLKNIVEPSPIGAVRSSVLIGLYYGLAMTHFFYDRYVYRFRSHHEIVAAISKSASHAS
jgi:hypothetical protein